MPLVKKWLKMVKKGKMAHSNNAIDKSVIVHISPSSKTQ